MRRAVLLSREREDALRRLADDYGTQAMEALGDLLTFSLDEDAAVSPGICMRGECAPKAMTRGESRPSWVAACRRSGTCSAPWAGRRWVISQARPPAASASNGGLERRGAPCRTARPSRPSGHSRRACAHRGGRRVRDGRNRQGRAPEADHPLKSRPVSPVSARQRVANSHQLAKFAERPENAGLAAVPDTGRTLGKLLFEIVD